MEAEASATTRMNIPYLDLKAVTTQHEEEIQRAVAEVVGSGWYLQGEAVQQFEQHYAQYIGTTHCIGVANGLDALTLTLRAYQALGRLHEGDEVLVPANTFIATVLAITENRLRPVFVDVEEGTLDLSIPSLEKAVTPQTKALMLVHLYGRCTYNQSIAQFCQAHRLLLIEDNAQAHGCEYQGRKTGSLGHVGCHSFYPGKNLGALGDAGAMVTNDEELAKKGRALGNYGSDYKYHHIYQGNNSRLDKIDFQISVHNNALSLALGDMVRIDGMKYLYVFGCQNKNTIYLTGYFKNGDTKNNLVEDEINFDIGSLKDFIYDRAYNYINELEAEDEWMGGFEYQKDYEEMESEIE